MQRLIYKYTRLNVLFKDFNFFPTLATCAEKPKKPDSIKKLEVNEDIKDVRTVQGVSNVNVTNRRYYPSNKNVSYYRTVVYSKAPLSYLSVHLLPVIVILAVL